MDNSTKIIELLGRISPENMYQETNALCYFRSLNTKRMHPYSTRIHLAEKSPEIDAQEQKCQNGKVATFLPNIHFGTFIAVHQSELFPSKKFLLSKGAFFWYLNF